MNAPSSFIPDQPSQPSSFVPDEPAKPQTFVPDAPNPVVFQNRTAQNGMDLTPSYTPAPATLGDAMAMQPKMAASGIMGSTPYGMDRSSPLAQLSAALFNGLADKSSPDFEQKSWFDAHGGSPTGHYRGPVPRALFGPSNLNVLGAEPDKQLTGEDLGGSIDRTTEQVLPGTKPMLDQPTAGQTLGSASMLLPFGVGPETTLGKAVLGYFGVKTLQDQPENIQQVQEGLSSGNYKQAARAGVNSALGLTMLGLGAAGMKGEPQNWPNMEHMNGPQSDLANPLTQPLSRSTPVGKEENQTANNEPQQQTSNAPQDAMGTPLSTEGQQQQQEVVESTNAKTGGTLPSTILNPGGPESALAPELQAQSRANNSAMAEEFARRLGVKKEDTVDIEHWLDTKVETSKETPKIYKATALQLKDGSYVYSDKRVPHAGLADWAIQKLGIKTDDIKASGFIDDGKFVPYGDMQEGLVNKQLTKDEQQQEQEQLHKMTDESGSLGLHVLDPEVWKELGFKAKVGGEQFINRLRNKLGGESAGWKMIDTPEFQSFMKSGPKTTQEVQEWVNQNGPKVEVRKFGERPIDSEFNKIKQKHDELWHKLETMGIKPDEYEYETTYHPPDMPDFKHPSTLPPEALKVFDEMKERVGEMNILMPEYSDESTQTHWQTIAPKSEKDMPGYTEIAVVKPQKEYTYDQYIKKYDLVDSPNTREKYMKNLSGKGLGYAHEDPQFPSSHNFPPNTLGFTRLHFENGGANSHDVWINDSTKEFKKNMGSQQGWRRAKIALINEVQSDWAQHIREIKERQMSTTLGTQEYRDWYKQKELDKQSDPLLPHYERLALKAAIDHAREQGADAIAISDAPTAMMTEGHDRQHTGWENVDAQRTNPIDTGIPQEPGMTLHYDRTLPKIAEELTGEKGQMVGFGEHKMAMDDSTHNQNRRLGYTTEPATFRKDLIFRNEQGEPKTDVTARMYPIDKAAKDFSIISKDKPKLIGNQGTTSESGAINLDAVKEGIQGLHDKVKDFFSDEGIRRKTMKMAGVSVPKTTAANEAVGNQLTMFAQAEGVAEAVARARATEVLGKHWKDKEFDSKLGAVGVEDQLRTLKAQLLAKGKTAEAMSVNTLVGQPYSPIKSEAQYQMLRNAPDIKDALNRHKQLVQPVAETNQKALKGQLRAVGQDTGTFFNLIPKGIDNGEIRKGKQGNPLATLKGGTRFGKEFKGTAAEYETSYRTMAERMIKGNWTEVEKQKLFDLVDKTGFGHLQKAGEDLPTFDKKMSPIPVQRRMAVIVKPGEKPVMKSQNETLWVPEKSAEEFRQAFQTDSPLKNELLQALGGVATKIQTAAGADAAIHVGNMAAAIVTSPEKATAVKLALKDLADTFETNPEVQKRLAAMAQEAGIVRQGEDEVAGWKKLIPGKNMISWVDQAGRLTLDQLYKDAVKRGESPDNPIWRRAAVQGTLGEYNKRLMPKLQQGMKELGISPFLTAGKILNRLSLKQLVLSPSRKAVDAQGGAKMRLRQALYATGLIVAAPMVINQMMTGSPFPKGVQPGQFVIKKNEDGSYVVGDIAKLLMWRRGLRNSGIQAVAKGIEDKQSVGQIAMQAGKDIGRGLAHPLAGPLVSTVDTALGSGVMSDRPAKPFSGRVKDAAKQLNPTAAMLLDSDTTKTGAEKAISGVGRVVGLNVTQNHVSRVNQLAHQWMERNGVPTGNEPAGPYRNLTDALRKNDASAARQAVGELVASGKTDKDIKEYYKGIPDRNFTDSAKHEEQFVSSLGDEDKQVYQKVKEMNKLVRTRFYQMFLPGAPIPRDKMPKLPSREPLPSRFPLQK